MTMTSVLGSRQLSLLRTIEAYPGCSASTIIHLDDRGESDPRSLTGRHATIKRLLEMGLVYDTGRERSYVLYISAKGRRLLEG